MAGVARLLCAFGVHAVAPGEAWNQGYGFARCRHCGRDLVRSLLDGWCEPPRGFRVVWRPATMPPSVLLPAARVSRATAAPPTTTDRDFMDEPPPPIRRVDSARAVSFDDFMSDAPASERSTGTDGRGAMRQRQ